MFWATRFRSREASGSPHKGKCCRAKPKTAELKPKTAQLKPTPADLKPKTAEITGFAN